MRIPFISLIAAGSLALGGCAYGDLGLGLGYGNGYYGGAYGSPYYGGYGYNDYYGGYGGYGAYGSPYFGWYDNYYYPGTGYYVYDSYRRPRMWSDRQRNYWMSRQRNSGTTVATTTTKPNWSRFNTRQTVRTNDQRENWQERRRSRPQ
jgi:hypothetical protein